MIRNPDALSKYAKERFTAAAVLALAIAAFAIIKAVLQ